MSTRGQTFTLEAFVAAIILLATLTFALQAVAISSDTASGGATELKEQQLGLAEGALDQAVQDGTLKQILLYWNESAEEFYGANDEDGYYISRPPPLDDGNVTLDDRFVTSLEGLFADRQVRYNIDLHYRGADNTRQTQRLVEFGTPNQQAVRVVETVTLYDNDTVLDRSGNSTGTRLVDLAEGSESGPAFYVPNAAADSQIYNVVRVEVVLWQS